MIAQVAVLAGKGADARPGARKATHLPQSLREQIEPSDRVSTSMPESSFIRKQYGFTTPCIIKNLRVHHAVDLMHVAECFPELESLDLSKCKDLHDIDILHVGMLTKLHTLSLAGEHNISDFGITMLPDSLQHLCLRIGARTTSKALELLPSAIRSIDLRGNGTLRTDVVQRLPQDLRGLRVGDCSELTDSDIAQLRRLPMLRNLVLRNCAHISNETIDSLANDMPHCRISC